MRKIVFDIETDGLIDEVSKIHVLSYQEIGSNEIKSIYDYKEIKEFITQKNVILIGHNILSYDIPVIKKLLEVEPVNQSIDTLILSWYLLAHKKNYKHGLEAYGERFKVPKIEVKDWDTDDIKLYTKRCERDVEINSLLWEKQSKFLNILYNNNQKHIDYVLDYFYWKGYHLSVNQNTGIFLNRRKTLEALSKAEYLLARKTEILAKNMPKDVATIYKKKPEKMYKKNGELSSVGERWLKLLKSLNLPENTEVIYEKPNPGSHTQVKEWLIRLGWKPDFFKENDKGELIPQINLPFGQGLSESVKDMMEEYPFLKHLDNYFKLKHRIGIFKGYLEKERNGKVYMSAHALTKTLRWSHSKPLVNLVKPGLFFGDEIREVLYAPKGWVMIGSDLSSLEDKTKQHYIYPFDKEYVLSMQKPGFDPHTDISVLAGLISKEDEDFFKKVNNLSNEEKKSLPEELKMRYKKIKKARSSGKTVNFASTYGAGIKKLQDTLKSTYDFAKNLWETYWKRNWAIKEVAQTFKIKRVGRIDWIYSPVSKLWIPITAKKDMFSAVNQNTGVFFFDSWVKEIFIEAKKYGKIPNIWLQYHDKQFVVVKPC